MLPILFNIGLAKVASEGNMDQQVIRLKETKNGLLVHADDIVLLN